METKISKCIIKKAEEIIGDDTGYIDSLETLIDSAKFSVLLDWIDELCKDKIDQNRLHYIVDLNCGGSHECYYQKLIEWLLVNGSESQQNIETFISGHIPNQKQLN